MSLLFEESAAVFEALGHPARLRLVIAIARAGEPLDVGRLSSELDPPLTGHVLGRHLNVLRSAGILEPVELRRRVLYALRADAHTRLSRAGLVLSHLGATAPLTGLRRNDR